MCVFVRICTVSIWPVGQYYMCDILLMIGSLRLLRAVCLTYLTCRFSATHA